MGTATSVKSTAGAIHGQVAIALALLSAWEHNARQNRPGPRIEEIGQDLLKLVKANIEIEDLALRKVPGGVYSEDVEAFIGHLLAERLATHRSPLQLAPEGEKRLRSIIRFEAKEHRSAIFEAARALGLDTASLVGEPG